MPAATNLLSQIYIHVFLWASNNSLLRLAFRVQIKPLLKSAITYNLGNMANGRVNGLADAADYYLDEIFSIVKFLP